MVDPETGDVRLLSYLTVQDAGFTINPINVEAQMEGERTAPSQRIGALAWGARGLGLREEGGDEPG